jgi:hypothetical protein
VLQLEPWPTSCLGLTQTHQLCLQFDSKIVVINPSPQLPYGTVENIVHSTSDLSKNEYNVGINQKFLRNGHQTSASDQ